MSGRISRSKSTSKINVLGTLFKAEARDEIISVMIGISKPSILSFTKSGEKRLIISV